MSKISVIIPALNEANNIIKTMDCLKKASVHEIIVVDGGSTDGTVAVVSPYAKVLKSPKGRAVQMNMGAAAATGDILVFLHADSMPTRESFRYLEKTMENSDIVGGGFKVTFGANSLLFRMIACGSNWRAKLCKIFFGDQVIFVRRKTFFEIGGYPDIPIMEDWELCRKMKARGKLVQLPIPVLTSPRRWQKYGTWKTILLMHKLKLLYLLGASPQNLKKHYPDN